MNKSYKEMGADEDRTIVLSNRINAAIDAELQKGDMMTVEIVMAVFTAAMEYGGAKCNDEAAATVIGWLHDVERLAKKHRSREARDGQNRVTGGMGVRA